MRWFGKGEIRFDGQQRSFVLLSGHYRHVIGDIIDGQSRQAGTQGALDGGGSDLGSTTGLALLGRVAAVALVAHVVAAGTGPPLLALLAMGLGLGFGVVELLGRDVQVGVHLGLRHPPRYASSTGRDPSRLRNLSRGRIHVANAGGTRALVVEGLSASSNVLVRRGLIAAR